MKPLALALALALAAPSLASAQGPAASSAPAAEARTESARLVAEAQRAYAELEFDEAVDAARRALASPSATDLDRIGALETLGSALVVLDREAAAREAFGALFRIDPYWVVREPSGSPRIRRVVDATRAQVVDDAALDPELTLRLEAPRAGRLGRALSVRVVAEGPAPHTVFVQSRIDGELRWTATEAVRESDAHYLATLAPHDDAGELELYAEARDARGRLMARAGGPLVPQRVPIRASEDGSITGEWWFWAAVGGGAALVVAGAIVLGVVAAPPARAPNGTLEPGRVELPLVRF